MAASLLECIMLYYSQNNIILYQCKYTHCGYLEMVTKYVQVTRLMASDDIALCGL